MTKGVERKLCNPLPGGLSMFDMDFISKGLSVAENISQKWGNICLDNIIVQNQCKYATAVGEHFRKVFDEVANDWLNPSNGCVEGPVSDLSLENDVITEVCERSRVAHDGYHHNEKLPLCVELETFVSSVEDLNPSTLASFSHDLSHKKEKLIPTLAEATRSNCSDDMGESCNNISNPVASLAYVTSAHPSLDEVPFPDFHDNEVMEGESMLLDPTLSTGIHAVTESYDGFNREVMLNIHGGVDATKPTEEFEDVKLEDFGDDTEKYEVALIPNWAPKYMSYKRKLKYAFRAKLPSSKCYGGNNMGNRPGIASSFVSCEALYPKTASTPYSRDSDWELL